MQPTQKKSDPDREESQLGLRPVHLWTFVFHKPICSILLFHYFVLLMLNPGCMGFYYWPSRVSLFM